MALFNLHYNLNYNSLALSHVYTHINTVIFGKASASMTNHDVIIHKELQIDEMNELAIIL